MALRTTQTTALDPWHAGDARLRTRRIINRLMLTLAVLAIAVTLVPLVLLLGWVALQGLPALNVDFFTKLPGPPDDPHTGFANGIVGTLVLIAIAGLISVPVGIGAGIYLSQFGRRTSTTAIRFASHVPSADPAISIGALDSP